MDHHDRHCAESNVIPFRPRPGPEQMVREVEAALRRMWQRIADEPLPDALTHLLNELECQEALHDRNSSK